MTPVLVEPLSEQAYELLRQLDALHVLRMVAPSGSAQQPDKPSVAGLIGSISPEAGKRMLAETAALRDEWES